MTRIINKDALIAWIKGRIDQNRGKQTLPQYFGMVEEDLNILSYIDSLEVKEVDLEKEKDDYWNKLCDSEFGELLERDAKWFDDIAQHFFELGMAISNKE